MTKMTPLDIWKTEFTPEVITLAKLRILDGDSLATRRDIPKHAIKLALILVRILNPPEELSEAETAILMGVTSPTLKKMREEKKFLTVMESLETSPGNRNNLFSSVTGGMIGGFNPVVGVSPSNRSSPVSVSVLRRIRIWAGIRLRSWVRLRRGVLTASFPL